MTPADVEQNQFCSECGQPRPSSELARFGDRLICPNCKNSYAQKLREGVAPATALAYAGFWIRFLASLIDGIILSLAQTVVLFATGLGVATTFATKSGDVGAAMSAIGITYLGGLVMGCSYETFFLGKFGATPGKMALGLKVVRPDGSPVNYARAAGRYFSKILSAIIIFIGYIMAGFDSQKRALHDMICDTRVIRTRS